MLNNGWVKRKTFWVLLLPTWYNYLIDINTPNALLSASSSVLRLWLDVTAEVKLNKCNQSQYFCHMYSSRNGREQGGDGGGMGWAVSNMIDYWYKIHQVHLLLGPWNEREKRVSGGGERKGWRMVLYDPQLNDQSRPTIKRSVVWLIVPWMIHLGWCRSKSRVIDWGGTVTARCQVNRAAADTQTHRHEWTMAGGKDVIVVEGLLHSR